MPPSDAQLDSLRAMSASALDPTLTEAELLDVLARNNLVDGAGLRPDDPDWEPTYAMGAAAQDAWLLKAGKAANRVQASDGALSVQRQQLIAHCLLMADRYGARRYGTLVLAGTGGPVERERLPVWNDDLVMPDGDNLTMPIGGSGADDWLGAA